MKASCQQPVREEEDFLGDGEVSGEEEDGEDLYDDNELMRCDSVWSLTDTLRGACFVTAGIIVLSLSSIITTSASWISQNTVKSM